MRKITTVATVLCVVGLLMIAAGCSDREGTFSPVVSQQATDGKFNPNPGPDPEALPTNLSYPVIWAYPATDSLLNPYISKTESITTEYDNSSYSDADPAIVEYLQAEGPWYPQPPFADENQWEAEHLVSGETHMIYFIDWGNPMENTAARVGWRFPVEVAFYKKMGELTETGFVGTTMEAFTMACLEFPASREELFGTNKAKYESCFATVLTTEFSVAVRKLDGGAEYSIRLDPGVGPSGKMNFASANGGWIPTEPGWHRITLTINDPNIDLSSAIIANDDHFNMVTGEQFGALSPQKQELSGIFYNTTWIDVYVEKASGRN